jgi:hypothetical protein
VSTLPEALRLAECLTDWRKEYDPELELCDLAAAELRRLHKEILVYHDDRLKLSNEVDRLKAALGLIASIGPRPAVWRGLTNDEHTQLVVEASGWNNPTSGFFSVARAIEAKLKEKNHGTHD